jgi:hypothetical protein
LYLNYVIAFRDLLGNIGPTSNFSNILGKIAWDLISSVPAWQENLVQNNHAVAAVFSTSWFLASVTANDMGTLTWHFASKGLVHTLGMTVCWTYMLASWKMSSTNKLASSFRAVRNKIVGFGDFDLVLGVTWTAKRKTLAY